MKVFLGGTVNGSKWRSVVKEQLKVDYFDPVVKDWNDAAYERELSERRFCDYLLYVLTPKMTGYYAVAEVTDDSYHRPDRTIYCYLPNDEGDNFTEEQIVEFERLGRVVKENGGIWLKNLDEVIAFLNSSEKKKYEIGEESFDAFVSFGRRESNEIAHAITNRLGEKGLKLSIDLSEIPVIIENEEYIYSNILRSDNFIYIISPNSVRSEYCKKELEFAIKFNKRIIPVLHKKLGKDIVHLDDIVAKKNIIEIKNPEKEVVQISEEVLKVVEIDKDYVRAHSNYLFQGRKWNYGGRKQADLLSGDERNKAIEWLSLKNESLVPILVQKEFIEASENISGIMQIVVWLNERTRWITNLKYFDKVSMIISFGGPVAMLFTLFDLIIKSGTAKGSIEVGETAQGMWWLFLFIQITLTFVGIKHKDLRLFLSMFASIIISIAILGMILFYKCTA